MRFLVLFKDLFLGGYEKQNAKYWVDQRFELFKLLYFLRWKNELPLIGKFSEHFELTILFYCRTADYVRRIKYIYLIAIFIIELLNLMYKPSLYLAVSGFLMIFTLTFILKVYFIRKFKT